MDPKDVRIFCEMAFKDQSYNSFPDRRVSPSEIGKRLGLDEKTVRARVGKMEEEGFTKYYQAIPNLGLFGMKFVNRDRFETLNIATKRRVVDYLENVHGMVEIFDYLGPFLSVNVAGVAVEEIRELADSIARRFELGKIMIGEGYVKDCSSSRHDRLDWRIVQKLRYDARCTTKEVVSALATTPRLVDYRVARLLDSGALMIRAVLNTQKQQGLIFYELELSIDEDNLSSIVKEFSEN